MTRVGILAGRILRPNNSLAPIFGSLGLASGGSGLGSMLPLSCANAPVAVRAATGNSSHVRIRRVIIGSFYSARECEFFRQHRDNAPQFGDPAVMDISRKRGGRRED